jgi:hypothetical protein
LSLGLLRLTLPWPLELTLLAARGLSRRLMLRSLALHPTRLLFLSLAHVVFGLALALACRPLLLLAASRRLGLSLSGMT